MKFKVKGNSGFSLIELMVVVGIIGILATLALPKLNVFMAKARQSEAKTNLGSIYTLQEVYKADNGAYGADIATIGFTQPVLFSATPPGPARYSYSTSTTAAGFIAWGNAASGALGTGCGVDNWNIDQTKNLQRSGSALACN